MTSLYRPNRTTRSSVLGRLVMLVAFFVASTGFAATPTATAWDFIYGNAGPSDYSRYMDVALAPDGSSYIAGFFAGAFHGLSSPDAYRYFLQHIDANGVILWTKEVPTPVLPTSQVPNRPQIVVDGLGNPFLEADRFYFAYTDGGTLAHTIAAPSAAVAIKMSAAPAGGIVVYVADLWQLRRYAPDLTQEWSFDLSPYVDTPSALAGFFGQAAVSDGTFWVVAQKSRAIVTQQDATALIHIAADGSKIAAIKQFGFTPYAETEPGPIVGVSDNMIVVEVLLANGAAITLKAFAASDGHYLGEFPSVHPSHSFTSSKGAVNCGGIDLRNQDRLDPTAAADYTRTAIRKLVMNGTRLVTVAYCGSPLPEKPIPFMISYAVGPVGPNALTFLTARELTSTTMMEAMDANDLGDQIVVGSSTSTVVYVGGVRSLGNRVLSTQQRALAAKNPVGSLFYGLRLAGTVLEVKLGGRLNVPTKAAGVSLNITAIGAKKPGTLKVYPCGSSRTSANALTYPATTGVSASVISRLGRDGKVCIYTTQATHLAVDLGGQFPPGSSFSGRNPVRFLETRAGVPATFDNKFSHLGQRTAGSTTQLQITGRGAIPTTANAVAVTLHVFTPKTAGSLYAYPCGGAIPAAPVLTFAAGQNLSVSALLRLGTGGRLCVRTTAATHLAADVSGHFVAGPTYVPYAARRLLDTRAVSRITVDGTFWKIGERPARMTTKLQVTGRGAIPVNATAITLAVTVSSPRTAGTVTVYACGAALPNTPNLVFAAGKTVTNTVVSKIGTGGKVCLYTTAATQLAADATGHFTGLTAFTPRPKPLRLLDTRTR